MCSENTQNLFSRPFFIPKLKSILNVKFKLNAVNIPALYTLILQMLIQVVVDY